MDYKRMADEMASALANAKPEDYRSVIMVYLEEAYQLGYTDKSLGR